MAKEAQAPETAAPASQRKSWSGRTDSIIVPQLSSEYWTPGRAVTGTLTGWREVTFSKDGAAPRTAVAYRLTLKTPIDIDGESVPIVELPPLTGLIAAYKDLKAKGYSPANGDVWEVTCTDVRKAKREGYSDSAEFSIDIIR